MRTNLMCGTQNVAVELPDDAVLIDQGMDVKVEPVVDLPGLVGQVLDKPLDVAI